MNKENKKKRRARIQNKNTQLILQPFEQYNPYEYEPELSWAKFLFLISNYPQSLE